MKSYCSNMKSYCSNMKSYCSKMKSYCSEFINLTSPPLLSPKGWPYWYIYIYMYISYITVWLGSGTKGRHLSLHGDVRGSGTCCGAQRGCRGIHWGPRGAQEGYPKGPEEPRGAQRGPEGPRGAHRRPKGALEEPNRGHVGVQ